jgi:hypothetical protein
VAAVSAADAALEALVAALAIDEPMDATLAARVRSLPMLELKKFFIPPPNHPCCATADARAKPPAKRASVDPPVKTAPTTATIPITIDSQPIFVHLSNLLLN